MMNSGTMVMQADVAIARDKKSRNYLDEIKVLVIEDDYYTQLLLSHVFMGAGAEVFVAGDGHIGIKQFFDHQPDLIILDIMMPDLDGFDVCRQIRERSNVPIIMLTALTQEKDIIKGLEAGANNFMSKPFSQAVLLSQAKAVVRNSLHFQVERGEAVDYSDGYLTINLDSRRIWKEGEPIKLTSREFDMLRLLFENTGTVQGCDRILDQVWGWDYRDCTQMVHFTASTLRQKIERDPKEPNYIRYYKGIGYSFLSTNSANSVKENAE